MLSSATPWPTSITGSIYNAILKPCFRLCRLARDPRRAALFYAQSWALVHYLMLGQKMERQPQLKAYLDAIVKGMSMEQAFQIAFKMTFAEMQRELEAYAGQSRYSILRVSRHSEDLPAASIVEALTETEAEYVQGDLLVRINAHSDAERALDKILKLTPSYMPAKVSLASLRVAQDRHREAIDMLRPIAETEPTNFRAHFHLAQAYAKSELWEDALLEYRQAATVNDQSTGPWLGISTATAILGRQAESDAAMDRLQKLETSPSWYQACAYEAFHAGGWAAALKDARKYIENGRNPGHPRT